MPSKKEEIYLKLAMIANDLDSQNYYKEANYVTKAMLKIAQTESLIMQKLPEYINRFGSLDKFIEKYPAFAAFKQIFTKLMNRQPLSNLEIQQIKASVLPLLNFGNLEVITAVQDAKNIISVTPGIKLLTVRNLLVPKYSWLNNGQDQRFQEFNNQLLNIYKNK